MPMFMHVGKKNPFSNHTRKITFYKTFSSMNKEHNILSHKTSTNMSHQFLSESKRLWLKVGHTHIHTHTFLSLFNNLKLKEKMEVQYKELIFGPIWA